MGASLARWLASAGLPTLVLDRRAPAADASGRNGGMVVAGAHAEYVELAAQIGPANAQALIQASLENHRLIERFLEQEGLGSAWQTIGFLALWESEAERRVFAESAPTMNQLGWEMRVVDRDVCERILGTRLAARFQGGAWTPRDAVVQPVTLVYALTHAAARKGACFVYPCEVQQLRPAAGGWELVTALGTVQAEHVVLATNQRTERLLPAVGPLLRYVRDTVATTAPVVCPVKAGWAEHSVAPYGRPDGDRLVFGGFAGHGPVPPLNDEPPVRPEAVQAALNRYLDSSFPELGHPIIEHAWTGTLAITRDHLPLIGPWPGAERLWLLTGFGGQGLPFALWAPRQLAAAIVHRDDRAIPAYLRPARFFAKTRL